MTRGLQTFLNDKPSLAGAETAGLYKMLSAEYQKIKSKTIDVDGHVGTAAELRQVITDEACADGLYSEICYRNGERYIPYVEKLHAAEINRKLSGLLGMPYGSNPGYYRGNKRDRSRTCQTLCLARESKNLC